MYLAGPLSDYEDGEDSAIPRGKLALPILPSYASEFVVKRFLLAVVQTAR